MSFIYTYNITNDFLGGKVNPGQFQGEILNSSIITLLEDISTTDGSHSSGIITGGSLEIKFVNELTASEKTTLDGDVTNPAGGLISAHIARIDFIKNHITTIPPPETGSEAEGFGVGSKWINTTTDKIWICTFISPLVDIWRDTTQEHILLTSTTNATTTSSSDTLIPSMTVTITDPRFPKYNVWFSGSVSHSTLNNPAIYVNLYIGNVKISGSERFHTMKSSNDVSTSACSGIFDSSISPVLEVRWRTSEATATITNRSLLLIRYFP